MKIAATPKFARWVVGWLGDSQRAGDALRCVRVPTMAMFTFPLRSRRTTVSLREGNYYLLPVVGDKLGTQNSLHLPHLRTTTFI